MNIARIIQEISNLYGKPYKKYYIGFLSEAEMIIRINFGEEENINLKFWIKEDFNCKHPYEIILWKENIYINKYIMSEDKYEVFDEFYKKIVNNKLDYIFGTFGERITIDNKMKKYIYKELHKKQNEYIKYFFRWDSSKDGLTDILYFERLLNKYFKYMNI